LKKRGHKRECSHRQIPELPDPDGKSKMPQNQIRQNKITRQWVIYAPDRGQRPNDFQQKRPGKKKVPERDADCPFCPGNENKLASIVMETPGLFRHTWQTRVVPNKFPALMPAGSTSRSLQGIYIKMEAHGRHEVIIESPRHDQDIATMSVHEVLAIIETYHMRYTQLLREHEHMLVVIFRNHGDRAGTSLMHPHSQLVVTGVVPQHIRSREEEAQRYFDERGRCVYCEILDYEAQEQERLILGNDSFLVFIPFAAEVPFEIWIIPKRHQADFGSISGKEKSDLASTLIQVLRRLRDKLDDPDYNYVINSSARYRADEPQLHWYLQIRPRLTTPAGFEIGSGMSINPSLPEQDAEFLNEP